MKRLAILFLILAGCGGGESPLLPPPDNVAHTLHWEPPTIWADNTPLNPRFDIAWYDIYACDNLAFLDNLLPCATVRGVDNEARVASFFDLWLLAPYNITPPKWISMKSVSKDNVASQFGPPVLWEPVPWE
jgi:hypothetical protein